MKTNFTFKNIREFVPGDSLYAAVGAGDNRNVFSVDFVSFEAGKVSFKLAEATTNPEIHKFRCSKGEVLTARLASCAVFGKSEGADGHESYHWFDALGFAAYSTPQERTLRVPAEHPSYGMITVNKSQGGGNRAFFGSPILQNNAVRFEISEAKLDRSLHNDHIYSQKSIISVEMTAQQFADLLTSVNSGGVPATILYRDGESVEPCPFVSKIEQFQDEFEAKVRGVTASMSTLMEKAAAVLKAPKAPSKGEREMLLRDFESIQRELQSNLPFVGEQFAEQMDRVVGEAKAAISAHVQECARSAGLPAPAMPEIIAIEDSAK